ncbi:hypothetical protein TCAL_02612 [Tigriopus californicus]|uniref:AB hydrolase-1 domain-containing protein n=1 Tax=Tigriopus californicus TaxID=6832 RepID=A0A553NFW0_TIGCA|nr:hypothetical protein TCAL_02612 [Tigriopus californicus]|eukprot:TCALIF_02612-PA protein Name:"Similar to Abhd3 Abhydrolase domain-containing protein 3 (Mus musculus)" AED:0.03 eAED:0.03 QI:153/0.25/0.2/1/1/1/5/0/279
MNDNGGAYTKMTRYSKFKTTMSSFEAGFQFLLERPWTSLTSLVMAGLVVYYHLKVVAPVKFICKKGSQLEKLFRKSLPVANEMFKPTIWCFEARFQTVFASVCRAFIPDIPYRREGTESLEKYGMNRMLNRHLASCLVDSIKEVRHHFDSNALYNLEKVFSSGTIREFDSTFTAPLFGYSDVKDYYTNATIAGKIHKIRIPYLALNAEDDPFQPGDSLPYEEVARSDYASMLSTKYGGHIGFMEGFFPSRYHFSDRVFQQYAGAVFHHLDEFRSLNQKE